MTTCKFDGNFEQVWHEISRGLKSYIILSYSILDDPLTTDQMFVYHHEGKKKVYISKYMVRLLRSTHFFHRCCSAWIPVV